MASATEVAVVGAGIVGLTCATHLARQGARVAVYEKDDVGFEASGRNMGAIGVLGKHAAALAAASVDAWSELVEGRPDAFGYEVAGRLYVGHDERDMTLLRAMAEHGHGGGAEIEVLGADDVRRRFPFLAGVAGGAFSALDALVEPVKVMAALREAAVAAGVAIHAGELVGRLGVRSGRLEGLSLASGRPVGADAVVVAAGVWSYRLLERAGVHLPHQLVELFHGVTDPQPAMPRLFVRGPTYGLRQHASGAVRFTGGYRNPGVRHSLRAHDLRDLRLWMPRLWRERGHVTLRVDPRYLALELSRAAAPTGFNPRVPGRYLRGVLERIRLAVPGLARSSMAHAYGGVVDLTPDALPVLGRAREDIDGLFVGLGFNGQGFGLGPVVGRLLAGAVQGRAETIPLAPYRSSRFDEGPVTMPDHLI